jgi:hydroxyacylglutathione hydrolase
MRLKIGNNVLFWSGIQAGSGLIFSRNNIVVVDTQTRPDQAALMVELIELHGLNPKDVRYIINTHSDHDHSGGNAELKRATGAKLVAHTKDALYIENGEEEMKRHLRSSSKFRVEQSGPFESCQVDVKVEGDMDLTVGDLTLKILHTPGHTNGSICVYYKDSKVLFSGDTVINERCAGPPHGKD